jgi:4-hydroxybenzoate decarboxylase subunit C
VVDDAKACASSSLEFLWQLCTRFEPAVDLYAAKTTVVRNAVSFSLPLLFDARIKPLYYPEALPSAETVELVERRWHEYFPS